MTFELLRTEQVESWGKHALEVFIDGKWVHLHTDYMAFIGPMKKKIEQLLAAQAQQLQADLDSLDVTLDDEQAAHQETILMLDKAKARIADLEQLSLKISTERGALSAALRDAASKCPECLGEKTSCMGDPCPTCDPWRRALEGQK